MTSRSDLAAAKPAKRDSVLGRSAATGQPVLRPASKGGTISLRAAKAAADAVRKAQK